jgi:hypothetical protein
MSRVQRVLLVLLMLMLPAQGAMAASRWLCIAAAHHGDAGSIAHAVPQVDSHAGSHHAAIADAAGHAHADAHDMDVHGAQGSAPHSTTDSCNLCAACGVTAAAPPPALALAALPPAELDFLPIFVPVPHNIADGLERPPRKQ